jgi:hypothetical protein
MQKKFACHGSVASPVYFRQAAWGFWQHSTGFWDIDVDNGQSQE